jgi:hypothetical protein
MGGPVEEFDIHQQDPDQGKAADNVQRLDALSREYRRQRAGGRRFQFLFHLPFLPCAAAQSPVIEHIHRLPLQRPVQTTFGSAKDAVVLTPTHLYARCMSDVMAFSLADLKKVVGFKGVMKGAIPRECLAARSLPAC